MRRALSLFPHRTPRSDPRPLVSRTNRRALPSPTSARRRAGSRPRPRRSRSRSSSSRARVSPRRRSVSSSVTRTASPRSSRSPVTRSSASSRLPASPRRFRRTCTTSSRRPSRFASTSSATATTRVRLCFLRPSVVSLGAPVRRTARCHQRHRRARADMRPPAPRHSRLQVPPHSHRVAYPPPRPLLPHQVAAPADLQVRGRDRFDPHRVNRPPRDRFGALGTGVGGSGGAVRLESSRRASIAFRGGCGSCSREKREERVARP